MSLQDAKLLLTPNAYKASNLYAIKPIDGSGDATVTRNTTKTRVNSSGLIERNAVNVLAPDYLNGVCPALNVEGQATNFILYSEQLDNPVWSTGLTITPNDTTSPDNTLSAEKLSGTGALDQTFSVTNGQKYTVSVFAKALTLFEIDFRVQGNIVGNFNQGRVVFDLSNKTFNILSGGENPEIKALADDWFKLSYTVTANGTGSTIFRIQKSFAGEFYLWGAQAKEGTEPTSYIPTTTATVTRSADNVTVPIPVGTTEIIEKYEDGTTNTITTIPASPYTVPTGKRYEYILMR